MFFFKPILTVKKEMEFLSFRIRSVKFQQDQQKEILSKKKRGKRKKSNMS